MAEFVASMSRGMEDGLATSRRVVIAVMVVVMMGLMFTKMLVVGKVKEWPPAWGSMDLTSFTARPHMLMGGCGSAMLLNSSVSWTSSCHC